MEFNAFSSSGSFELQPCSVCGRKFNPDTLTKHETVCRKSELKSRQRKVFDSGKQRLQGTGASLKNRVKVAACVQSNPIKETNWREKHLDFVNSIRSARAAQRAINTGGPLPPPPPPSKNPNYIECPHCTRRFNRTAAERHISFCAQRTKTYGAPVKPLHKRAAADVSSCSTSGVRKAYDNQVVRRKGNANPYAYAQTAGNEFPSMPLYSASFGAGAQEPDRSYRQEFRGGNSVHKHSAYNSPTQNTSKTTHVNNNQQAKRSALSSGRSRAARPKSSVRFSDKVDVETFQNGNDTLPSPRPPAHPPPPYPGTNGSSNHHGTQGGYRTTKASDMRLQRAQTAGNVGLGLPPRQRPTDGGGANGVGGGGRMNSTFSWREDQNSPSFETTTRLDSPRGVPSGNNFSPPSPGRSSNSPQSFTPPQRGGSHTPSPLSSPSDATMPSSPQYMSMSPKHGATLEPSNGSVLAPFCYHCGTKYPVQDARFCCGCGTRRAYLSPNSLS